MHPNSEENQLNSLKVLIHSDVTVSLGQQKKLNKTRTGCFIYDELASTQLILKSHINTMSVSNHKRLDLIIIPGKSYAWKNSLFLKKGYIVYWISEAFVVKGNIKTN